MSSQALADAREALELAAAARPRLDSQALTDAIKALCRWRDTLRHTTSTPEVLGELKAVNALISLVHAVHYPIDSSPWSLLDRACRGVEGLQARQDRHNRSEPA